ncbi:MAG: 50S ribosomal protein L25 [Planctomycetes bacterium]|nr:50S ribosomal protein L25 [Planctomycetota bacterium]
MSKSAQSTTATLKAPTRAKLGSRSASALRAQGMIPASIEWQGERPHLDVSVDEAEFLTSRRRHQHVYQLQLDSGVETTIVRELQWDVFGEHITHIEFRRVDLNKKTEVEVDLHFVGHPKGVLNQLVAHVKVLALPTQIPDELEVSVADLEPGTSVTAGQIKLPEGVELVSTAAMTVARISEIKVEAAAPVEAATAAPAAAPAAGAAPAAAAPAAEKKEGGKK